MGDRERRRSAPAPSSGPVRPPGGIGRRRRPVDSGREAPDEDAGAVWGPSRRWHLRRDDGERGAMARRVPGYVDLAEIGHGRCSTVYRAREVGTDRLVALKVIDVSGVATEAMASFRREATALAALGTHPHIVTLYRTVDLDGGAPALVLELCDGSLADQLAARGPLAARRATAVAVKIAGALETAHRAGVLHLDVKPANILVTQFGEPALTDFGVARLRGTGGDGPDAAGLPSTAVHAAPELVEGTAATAASDVYQLAATLYHLVAGRPAFEAFEGERRAAVALRVLYEPPAPLPRDVAPSALSDLVLWAMAKDPAHRPHSAAAFADALRAVELTCGWSPTAPAIPGGHMPRLAVGPGDPSETSETYRQPPPGSVAFPPAPPAPPAPPTLPSPTLPSPTLPSPLVPPPAVVPADGHDEPSVAPVPAAAAEAAPAPAAAVAAQRGGPATEAPQEAPWARLVLPPPRPRVIRPAHTRPPTVTIGSVTAGSVTAGSVTAGSVTAGPVTGGPVTGGSVTAGPVTGGSATAGPPLLERVDATPVIAAGAAGPADGTTTGTGRTSTGLGAIATPTPSTPWYRRRRRSHRA